MAGWSTPAVRRQEEGSVGWLIARKRREDLVDCPPSNRIQCDDSENDILREAVLHHGECPLICSSATVCKDRGLQTLLQLCRESLIPANEDQWGGGYAL